MSGEPGEEVDFDAAGVAEVDVVGVVERVEIEAVVAEKGGGGDGIEVDAEHEDTVVEAFLFRLEAAVHDIAFIEGRGHGQGSFPRRDLQSSIADQRPSSWKPLRCHAPQK